MLTFLFPRRADQEYQAPPFYQGELGYNPGFDGDDPEKAGLDGEEGLPGELRFVRKYKRQRKINILGTLVRFTHHWVLLIYDRLQSTSEHSMFRIVCKPCCD